MNVDVTILSNTIYVVTDETGRTTVTGSNPSPGQAGIYWLDEGVALGARGTVDQVNFVGSGVTVTRSGDALTVTITSGGGSGDVVGPSGATANNIATYDGGTGKLIKDSGVAVSSIPSLTNLQTLLYFYADPSVSVPITNQPVAETFITSSARTVQKFDATKYTAVRIVCNVTALSNSVNTPRLYPKYKTTYAAGDAIGTFTTVGTASSPEVSSLAAVGISVSDWITLDATMKADNFWTIAEIGGDAAADPAFGSLYLEFRV